MKAIERAAALAVGNASYGPEWVPLALPDAHRARGCIAALRNRWFLVQVFVEPSGYTRLSVNRTSLTGDARRWADGITWDELMVAKAAAGYAARWCVEAYPPDDAVIDIANIRHLFVLDEAPPWAWKTAQSTRSH